jgi:hypothetical protein
VDNFISLYSMSLSSQKFAWPLYIYIFTCNTQIFGREATNCISFLVQITRSTNHSPGVANSPSPGQGIHSPLLSLKVHYRLHKSPSLAPIHNWLLIQIMKTNEVLCSQIINHPLPHRKYWVPAYIWLLNVTVQEVVMNLTYDRRNTAMYSIFHKGEIRKR